MTGHGFTCPSHVAGADTCLVQLVLIQCPCCSLHLAVDEAIEDADTAEPKHKVDPHENGGVGLALDAVKAAGADYGHQDVDGPQGGKAGRTYHPGAHQCQHYPLGTEHLGKELRVGNEEVASHGNEAEGEDGDGIGDKEEETKNSAEGGASSPVQVEVGVHREGLEKGAVEQISYCEVGDEQVEAGTELGLDDQGQQCEHVAHSACHSHHNPPGNCHITIAQHRLMVAGKVVIRGVPHDGG